MTAQAQPRPSVDPALALHFLQVTYGDVEEPFFLNIFTLPGEKSRWFPIEDLEGAAEYAASCSAQNVYFGVGLHRTRPQEGRGRASDVAAVPGFWFDLDLRGEGHAEEHLPTSVKEAREMLLRFPVRPSLIVHSGGGLQVYWIFREPWEIGSEEERQRATRLSKGIQNHLRALGKQRGWRFDQTGDLARVLRLPGTLNRKTDPPRPVRVLKEIGENRYNPDDFEQFVVDAPQEPREARTASGGSLTPEETRKIRAALGYIDADEYETWVQTGMSLHDATGGSEQGFGLFNEFSLRSDKYDPRVTQAKWNTFTPGGGRTIASLFADAKAAGWVPPGSNGNGRSGEQPPGDDARPPEVPVLDPADPAPGARLFQRLRFEREGFRTLQHQGGSFYVYNGARYEEIEEPAVRAMVWQFAEGAQREHKGERVAFQPTVAKVANLMEAIRAVTHLSLDRQPPCWLETRPGDPDPAELAPMADGILHIPSRRMLPATPRLYTHHSFNFSYDVGWAPAPVAWLEFLDQLWPDDPDSVQVLQEMMGYLLLPDTSQQKAFLMVGPPRSGKGTIGRVITAMLGQHNICAPTLGSMSSQFGLQPMIGKLLALVSDARLSSKSDPAAIAERILSVSGEDSVTVDRKHLPPWTGRLATRFLVLTNELPRLADSSGALASRFIVLTLRESFLGREDPALTQRLLRELPDIFGWALDGWERLTERGHFVQPKSSEDAIQELEDLGSPISAFIRDRCRLVSGASVECKRMYSAWKSWCEAEGRDHPGTAQTFGRDLRAAVPGLRNTQVRVGEARVRCYEGIGLA